MSPTWLLILQTREMSDAELEVLPDYAFAFPVQRQYPLTNAQNVRHALEHFLQVPAADDADRELAWANIQKAAAYFQVPLQVSHWRDLQMTDNG
jgi:hypothetical protein